MFRLIKHRSVCINSRISNRHQRCIQTLYPQPHLIIHHCNTFVQTIQTVVCFLHNICCRIQCDSTLPDPIFCMFSGKRYYKRTSFHIWTFLFVFQTQCNKDLLSLFRKCDLHLHLPGIAVLVCTFSASIIEYKTMLCSLTSHIHRSACFMLTERIILPAIILDSPGREVISICSQIFVDIVVSIAVILITEDSLGFFCCQQIFSDFFIVHTKNFSGIDIVPDAVAMIFQACSSICSNLCTIFAVFGFLSLFYTLCVISVSFFFCFRVTFFCF